MIIYSVKHILDAFIKLYGSMPSILLKRSSISENFPPFDFFMAFNSQYFLYYDL